MTTEIIIADNPTQLAHQAARIILAAARQSLESSGTFNLCLAGGSTPRSVYQLLAQPENVSALAGTNLFWGDERCVPPQDEQSNYRMVRETMLDHLPAASFSVYRLEGELEPRLAAGRYQEILRRQFPLPQQPTFDLLLLGMGDDGHTASLFPHTPAIHETEGWAAAQYVPKLASWRLTLTPPVLNRARRVLFLAAGSAKATALHQVLESEYQPDLFPAQLIRPAAGNVLWLVDKAAAALLSPRTSGSPPPDRS